MKNKLFKGISVFVILFSLTSCTEDNRSVNPIRYNDCSMCEGKGWIKETSGLKTVYEDCPQCKQSYENLGKLKDGLREAKRGMDAINRYRF